MAAKHSRNSTPVGCAGALRRRAIQHYVGLRGCEVRINLDTPPASA
jgi:hypothetical protein